MLNRYSRIPGTLPHEYDNVFRPVNPVLDRNMFIFKVTVFINRVKYEYNTVFYASFRIFNM